MKCTRQPSQSWRQKYVKKPKRGKVAEFDGETQRIHPSIHRSTHPEKKFAWRSTTKLAESTRPANRCFSNHDTVRTRKGPSKPPLWDLQPKTVTTQIRDPYDSLCEISLQRRQRKQIRRKTKRRTKHRWKGNQLQKCIYSVLLLSLRLCLRRLSKDFWRKSPHGFTVC